MLSNKLKLNKFKQTLSSQYIRNVGWLGGAELANRVFRLATTVTLARTFSPQEYGLVAVIYTTIEFARVFTLRGGIGGKIIQADSQDVKAICDTAYWLNWILCGAVFIFQCLAAFPIAWFYGDDRLILPLSAVALNYLMLPLFLIQSALLERENRLKISAACNAIQSLVSNTIAVILAFLGMGVWAIVLPMILSTPFVIIITCRNHTWRPPKSFSFKQWQEITRFGGHLVVVELLNKLRSNIDYLIVGKFLGIEALGVYYFAFNAGLGITMNVMNSFSTALFPYLCEVRNDINKLEDRFLNSLKKTCTFVIPLVILQSSLAQFYVPIVFGEKWISAVPILVIICLSALPLPLSYSVYYLLNAVDKTRINLYYALTYTVVFAMCVLVSVNWGIFWVAMSVLICRVLACVFQMWAIGYVFAKKNYQ
ncbi:polysaccharide biosynthesis protein [Scytonema hofmannii PCC 7110]|uniref:Polysaccharide biosynthesis protein n=1 Tax=Scytonema hofmannii PCC 7110 TaxID=128403 RepID=A0A139X726_9CYAN|nr:lipopolysaccharide biosynthesis protein [Scytonema hofmannii]KYC40465.1 polysaccharide biosynthesis protein [Scytonema hofmannii PCC 7110]